MSVSPTAVNALLGLFALSVATRVSPAIEPGETPRTTDEISAATNIVIGLLLPETEPLSLSIRQGVLLGVEDFRRKGDVQVNLVIRGAVGQWGTDGVEAARMVTDDGAQGLIAPPDGAASHLSLQVSGRTAVPVVSLCEDSSVTGTGIPWMVRVPPRTSDEAKAIFSGLKPNARRWVACVPSGRRGREIISDLTGAAHHAGVALQKTIEMKWPLVDLPAFTGQLLTNGAEGILLWLDPLPAASVLKSLRTTGFAGRIAGPSRLSCSEFADAAGSSMDTFVVASPVREKESDARFERFAWCFRSRFGREPDATAAMSYDAAQLLLQILSRAHGRPAHELFPLDSSFPAVTGNLTFDAEGNRKLILELREGRNAQFICIR